MKNCSTLGYVVGLAMVFKILIRCDQVLSVSNDNYYLYNKIANNSFDLLRGKK